MSGHTFRHIESEDNAVFKQLTRLLGGRGMKKQDAALVSGPKVVADFLRRSPERCRAWINTARQAPPPSGFPDGAAWYQLTAPLFRAIDVAGTDSPLLLVQTPPLARWDPADGIAEGSTLFVPFQDPENVGAVIRSAVAFGVDRVVLLEESAHPYHPRALRASAGAVLGANLLAGPALSQLPASLPVVALSPDGADVAGFTFPSRFALLPGLEGPGLPDRFRAGAVSVPVSRGVESLNAATATAVVLYLWSLEARRAR